MATTRKTTRSITCSTLGLFAATVIVNGCATGPQTVAKLPAPSFAAPTVSSATPVKPPVAAPKQAVKPPAATPGATPAARVASGPRDWAPAAPARKWQWIVIHHSATASGGAAAFDRMHKAKGWDGLGYDFVIGNGTDTANGQVEVGYRWKQQLTGAHARTSDNRFNEFGVGICLVGNFDLDRPTAAQLKALNQLVAHLMRTYKIPADRIVGHGDTKPTDCPGRHTDLAQIRVTATQTLAAQGVQLHTNQPQHARATDGELLTATE